MKKLIFALLAAGCATHAMAADTVAYNSTPADGWFYGSGNDYVPANTAVLTTDSNEQIYLRMHETFQPASASNGAGVYSFALGTTPISFDWGIDAVSSPISALITITNVGTGTLFGYDPFFVGNDNAVGLGSAQNSFRLNWAPIGFDPNIANTYRVDLAVTGLGDKNTRTLSVYAQLGAGAGAVPEPATWAMMISGFGLVGAGMRRRVTKVSFA